MTEGARRSDGSLRLMDVVRLELNRIDVARNVNANSACFNVSDFIFGINNMGRGLVVRSPVSLLVHSRMICVCVGSHPILGTAR